jgi:Rap1a immunity proteins
MNRAFLIGVVFALLFTGRTNGQTPLVPSYTGEQLLHDCTENDGPEQSWQSWHCIGFIEGVWAGATWITYADKPKKPRFVLPESISLGDVTEVVIKFLKEHPKDLHFDAGVLVISALENGFPPKKR